MSWISYTQAVQELLLLWHGMLLAQGQRARCCHIAVHVLQGFTKEITMPREQWVGYIKDYDGGTLMEYVIHPKIPYADLVNMFKASAEQCSLCCTAHHPC